MISHLKTHWKEYLTGLIVFYALFIWGWMNFMNVVNPRKERKE